MLFSNTIISIEVVEMKKTMILVLVSLFFLTSCFLFKEEVKKEISFENKTFDNRLDKDGLTEGCFPSIGSPKLLVIPVNLEPKEATEENLLDIKIAFSGTEEETGFESVRTYYQKSSYGKLNIEPVVIEEWFTPAHSAKYYENYSSNSGDGSTLILREALEYYDSSIDYAEFDYNNDDYIDGVWLIYNCPVNYFNDSLYWAFVYWDYSNNTYDGKTAYYYGFAGIDFIHPTIEEAASYDPTDIKVDAHTFIHETGHLLGLDDYYDYDDTKGPSGGLYGADMMDANIGDHLPISKLLLGWVSPTIVSGFGEIELSLKPFSTSGEFLIISTHDLDSIYDSYYIVDYYTNDGLNTHDKPFSNNSIGGIRVTEIHAEKNLYFGMVRLNSGDYQTGFKYDNSDEDKLFVNLIYDSKISYIDYYSLDIDTLFQVGEELKSKNIAFSLEVMSMEADVTSVVINI